MLGKPVHRHVLVSEAIHALTINLAQSDEAAQPVLTITSPALPVAATVVSEVASRSRVFACAVVFVSVNVMLIVSTPASVVHTNKGGRSCCCVHYAINSKFVSTLNKIGDHSDTKQKRLELDHRRQQTGEADSGLFSGKP